jgi:hypothetical protein
LNFGAAVVVVTLVARRLPAAGTDTRVDEETT